MVLSDDVKAIFNAMHEGVLIMDNAGIIVFGNEAYLNFVSRETGIHKSLIVGKKLLELRPGARLPEVLRTGKPIFRSRRRESSEVYFVNLYPIIKNGEIIGGLSIVTFLDDAEAFKNEIESIERRSKMMLSSVNKSVAGMTFDKIISKGRKSAACKEYAKKLAETDFPVLLTSESGVGKGAYAQAIHHASQRAKEIYVSINCATMASRLELELFGCEPNAIEGYKNGSIGLLEVAKNGTVLIDEISEMSLELQSRILEVLQNHTIRRIGADYDVPINTRIIAATNVELTELVTKNLFKSELFYLLNTFNIQIPPLRERMDDVPVIVDQQLKSLSVRMKQKIGITDEALERLMTHNWPGNIRELNNVLEFSAYLAEGDMITKDSLPKNIGIDVTHAQMTLVERVREFEKAEILKVLEFHGNDLAGKKAAARELGISLASLYSKIK